MPSGPAAFLALILRAWFLTRLVVRDRLGQGGSVMERVGGEVGLMR